LDTEGSHMPDEEGNQTLGIREAIRGHHWESEDTTPKGATCLVPVADASSAARRIALGVMRG
jgi:hypothetical protein